MREVGTGVWQWVAPHPEWKPEEDWGELVSSRSTTASASCSSTRWPNEEPARLGAFLAD